MLRIHLRCALIYDILMMTLWNVLCDNFISLKKFWEGKIITTKEARIIAYSRVVFVMVILILLIKIKIKELYGVTRRGTIAVDGTISIFTIFSRRWCSISLSKIFCYTLKEPAINAFFYSIEIINIPYGLINVHIFNRNTSRAELLIVYELSSCHILFFLILILFPFSSNFPFIILGMKYIYLFIFKKDQII